MTIYKNISNQQHEQYKFNTKPLKLKPHPRDDLAEFFSDEEELKKAKEKVIEELQPVIHK